MKTFYALFFVFCLFTSSAFGQSVTWTSDVATPASGTASGTANWTMPPLTLRPGVNNVTVTANDGSGNTSSASIAITYAPTFPGNTLAGAWGFEEGSGATATDSSGNSNTGFLINAPTRATGRYGQGITLNGSNQYINVPRTNLTTDFTQSFSFMAWVQPLNVHNDFRSIVVKNYNIFLYASNNGTYCALGAPVIGFVSSGVIHSACVNQPLPINVPSFVAGTYDGANLKLYVNGSLVATTAATGYIDPTANASPGVAGDVLIGGSGYGQRFDGWIDEVRLYNFALPLTAASNTSFGTACSTTNQTDQNNIATASLVGAANCPIAVLVPPPPIAFGSSTTVSFGATNSGISFGATP